jgi:hypothetical protein
MDTHASTKNTTRYASSDEILYGSEGNHWTGCKLHPSKSKLESLELGCVWKYITGCNLNGAHSMVDVIVQTDRVTHKHFLPYLDVSRSFRLMGDIFTETERNKMLKKLEPSRPAHAPWFEQTAEDNVSWEPRSDDNYNGASAGGVFGLLTAMLQLARKGCLASMFFVLLYLPTIIVPLHSFSHASVRLQ